MGLLGYVILSLANCHDDLEIGRGNAHHHFRGRRAHGCGFRVDQDCLNTNALSRCPDGRLLHCHIHPRREK